MLIRSLKGLKSLLVASVEYRSPAVLRMKVGTLRSWAKCKYWMSKLQNDPKETMRSIFLPPSRSSSQFTVSVPFMITSQMKKKLLEIGQSPEDIKNMRPQEAQRILKNHSEQSRSVENFEHNMHTKQSEKTIDCFQRDDVKAEIPPLNKPVPFL